MNQFRQQHVGALPMGSETDKIEQTRNNEERPYGHDRPSVSYQSQSSSYPYPTAFNFATSNGLPNLPNIQKTLEMFRTTQFQPQHELQPLPLPLPLPLTVPPTEKNEKEKGLRRGKWTDEEVQYTDKIIEAFNAGTLELPEDTTSTTLRSYLSHKLMCDPMRITKKYSGAACLGKGKRVYQANSMMASAEVMAAVQKELQELEAKFLEKLEKSTRNRSGTETDIDKHLHTISTPSIDAMMTSQVLARPPKQQPQQPPPVVAPPLCGIASLAMSAALAAACAHGIVPGLGPGLRPVIDKGNTQGYSGASSSSGCGASVVSIDTNHNSTTTNNHHNQYPTNHNHRHTTNHPVTEESWPLHASKGLSSSIRPTTQSMGNYQPGDSFADLIDMANTVEALPLPFPLTTSGRGEMVGSRDHHHAFSTSQNANNAIPSSSSSSSSSYNHNVHIHPTSYYHPDKVAPVADADGLAQGRVQLQEQHQLQLQQLQQQLKQQPCSFPFFPSMFMGLGQGLATAPGQGLTVVSAPGLWLVSGQGQGHTQGQGRASPLTHGMDVMLGKRCREEDEHDHDHHGGGGGGGGCLSSESLSSASDGVPHAPPSLILENIHVKKRLSQTNLMALSSAHVAAGLGLSQDGKSGTVPSVSDLDMETMTAGGSDVGSEGDVLGSGLSSGLGQGLGSSVGNELGSTQQPDTHHSSHSLLDPHLPIGSSSSYVSLNQPYLDHPLPHLTWPSSQILNHHPHSSQTYTHPNQSTYTYQNSLNGPPTNETLTQNQYNSVLDFESMEMVSMLLSPCNQPGRTHSSSSNGSTGGLGLDLGLVHSQSQVSMHDHEAVTSLLGFYSHCQEESSQKDLLALEKQALEKQSLEKQSLIDADVVVGGIAVDGTEVLHQGDDEHHGHEHTNDDNHSIRKNNNDGAIPIGHHDDGESANGIVTVPVAVSCASTNTNTGDDGTTNSLYKHITTDIFASSTTTATTATISTTNIVCEESDGFGLEI